MSNFFFKYIYLFIFAAQPGCKKQFVCLFYFYISQCIAGAYYTTELEPVIIHIFIMIMHLFDPAKLHLWCFNSFICLDFAIADWFVDLQRNQYPNLSITVFYSLLGVHSLPSWQHNTRNLSQQTLTHP